MIIDTHCHFDMYPNPKGIIDEAEKLGIITIGMTNLPSHFNMGYQHIKGYKKIRLALGMHPLMSDFHSNEMPLFFKYINMTSYIGEIGLDFSKEGMPSKKAQLSSFKKVLEAVKGKNKILSIHSRKAEREVLELLKEYSIKNAIFHWYSGGLKLIDEIVDSGYFLSLNPAMIKSKNGQKIISRLPKEFVLTESDGPYIMLKGKVVKSKDIKVVIEYLAKEYDNSFESVENLISRNFSKLINRIK